MLSNYIIVLFKNKKKRKIIKRYSTEKNANSFFEEIIKKNKSIRFEKKIENATPTIYHLGLLTNQSKIQNSIYFVDDIGRNQPANLQNEDYVFIKLESYKLEEKIYDYQKNSKISFDEFIKIYCNAKELKNIFSINNKICIQIDEDVKLFSLKDIDESYRFLNVVEKYFYENSRFDAIFVRDVSNAQRKWIYSVLEDKGFNKRNLYRQKTTFSKR